MMKKAVGELFILKGMDGWLGFNGILSMQDLS